MSKQHSTTITQKIMLIFGSLVLCFIVIEIGYRIFDPFPYFSSSEINDTEHGNLAMYDPILGWKGVPWGKGELITKNNKVSLSHNKEGFRDLEHNSLKERKPAIAFLGDSFTWGYEVEFNDMFVNRLRNKLTNYEIFNLSFRGYGTDQEFLTFQNWGYSGPLKWVILIFCENDIIENNSLNAYEKPKPKYEIVNNQLELVGIPVPRTDSWGKNIYEEKRHPSWKESLAKVVFFSHFLHETYYRYKRLKLRFSKNYDLKANWPSTLKKSHPERWDLTLTYRILQELKHHVEERGAELVVFFIPPKRVVEKLDDASPSHIKADIEICTELGIKNHDLTPYFKKTFLRTYYRQGAHWNPRGHQVAAEAIYHYLITDVFP